MSQSNWPSVDPKQSFPALEHDVLALWNETQIFEQAVAREPKKGEFTFYDGPPFATGLPHYGHILQSVIKDVIPRYKTMTGYRVPRRWGWDCHGLPVENLIEKELNLADKRAIETFGEDRFNEACRASVMRFAAEWKRFIPRMGRWVDMEHDYKTMNPEFMESVWWVFGELWKKGLIYEGLKPMHVCPRCVTPLSNFEVGQGYRDVTDLSAIAKFKVVGEENTYFLAWTTTPWTLPGNVALAVNPEVEYALLRHPGQTSEASAIRDPNNKQKQNGLQMDSRLRGNDECFWLAKDLVEKHFKDQPIEILETKKGSDLVGKSYEPLFPYFANEKTKYPNAFTIRAADFVTTTDGTGIVHIAPAYGEDDLNLGKRDNLPTIQHVTMEGVFVPTIANSEMSWGKLPIKRGKLENEPDKVDVEIVKWLEREGKLFESKRERHTYPHCWRCDTPLLNYATSSWFVAVEQIKNDLLANNEKVNWIPEHVKAGRFGKWLEGARDWAISRNRYWGAPLPIWRCDTTGETICVSSVDELEKLSGTRVTDLHKHFVDEITWPNTKAADKAVEITFVRHGQTDWNIPPLRIQGTTDNPLNATGRQQAEELKKEINVADYDVIIASPLLRARQTAEILADGREVVIDELVAEKNFGALEGKNYAEVFAAFPEFKTPEDIRYRVAPPGGESSADVLARMRRFLARMQKNYVGKRVLVVAHGVMTRYFRYTFKHVESLLAEELPNCCVYTHTLVPTFRRIPEVLDCWFESGSMPYAQDATKAKTILPADFIAEAQDQTRGWFYTLHVLATALQNKPAFQNVICSGLVLAEDGQKMSKSKKNYPDPNDVIEKYGADAMRLYLLNSPVVRGEALRFSERGVEETLRGVLLPLWNTYYFFTTYATADGWVPTEGKLETHNSLDRWILSELNILIREMTAALERYELNDAVRPLTAFLDGLTNWYIRRSRRRFWKSESDTDKREAYATLHHVLTTVTQLLAPFCPFVADTIYRGLTSEKSVHLTNWPTANDELIDQQLSEEITVVRKIVSAGLAIRGREKLKVRQPLSKIEVVVPKSMATVLVKDYAETLKEELNIKNNVHVWAEASSIADPIVIVNARALGPRVGGKVQEIIKRAKAGEFEITNGGVRVGDEFLTGEEVSVGYRGKAGLAVESVDGIVVALDTTITPALEREGRARDLVRVIQDLRKEADYAVSNRIIVAIKNADDILADAELRNYIATETLATEIVSELPNADQQTEIEGVTIAVKRA